MSSPTASEPSPSSKASGLEPRRSFLGGMVKFLSDSQDTSDGQNELNVQIKISYKTLVFLIVSLALVQRASDFLFQ